MTRTITACEIISRNRQYVTFWAVHENGTKTYTFSDFQIEHQDPGLDYREYQRLMKRVNAADRFIGKPVHGG
jgi:hypothetical protein